MRSGFGCPAGAVEESIGQDSQRLRSGDLRVADMQGGSRSRCVADPHHDMGYGECADHSDACHCQQHQVEALREEESDADRRNPPDAPRT